MAYDINLTEASVYVGTYDKYNSGSLSGAWLELSRFADKDEFYEACAELHKDEKDPEYMFQDYENIPDALISESWISEKVFDIIDTLNQLTGKEQEPFSVWCNNGHHDLSTEDAGSLVTAFRDDYCGEYDSEEDYAMEFIDEHYDLSEFVKTYFDYAKYARELFMTDYWMDSGYVFRNS